MNQEWDAIVIGAGHNGLIAACYLARAGKRVLVLERRDVAGGACVTEEVWPGYHVSTGAYLCSLLLPEVVADLELIKYGFSVYRRETAGFAPFPDGRALFLYADADKTKRELERFCQDTPHDVEAFFQFEADVERAADILEPFLSGEPPSEEALRQAFAQTGVEPLYEQFVTGSVRALLDARFESEQLKVVLATDGLIGTYGGPSTPGTAYVLLHHYLGRILGGRGAWGYVRGGMGSITQALAQSLTASGGTICTSSPVKRILLKANDAAISSVAALSANKGQSAIILGASPYQRPQASADGENAQAITSGTNVQSHVIGVELENGEIVHAPIVLSNADPYRTFAILLNQEKGTDGVKQTAPPANSAPAAAREQPPAPTWERLKTCGGASVKINLAVSHLPVFSALYPIPPNTQHRISNTEHMGTVHLCPNMDTLERAWEEAQRGIPSTEPMIEMYMQTATDAGLAPHGEHMVSLFVQYFPYNLATGLDLNTERARFADRVFAIVERCAPGFTASIRHQQILTPRDLEAHFGLTGGHIFHGDLLPPNLWDQRSQPHARGARTYVAGLYLCGSGAHPGGCVYGAPGVNAAKAALLTHASAS